jgi:hypothetical protein
MHNRSMVINSSLRDYLNCDPPGTATFVTLGVSHFAPARNRLQDYSHGSTHDIDLSQRSCS